MFKKILVVSDGHEAGRAAAAFATELSGSLDASVVRFEVGAQVGRSQSSRDHQVAMTIADEATRVGADLVVLGLDRRQMGRHHRTGSVRQQLSQLTRLPVMAAPAVERPQKVTSGSRLARVNFAPRKALQHV